MNEDFLRLPVGPVALKMGVSVGIGMLIGLEREWSNKDIGIRTFAVIALMGMLASVLGPNFVIAALVGVLVLIVITNTRSMLVNRTLEITTSTVLILNYILGVLVGLGHIFTPVAGAIITTMLLAWKTELNKFAGGLKPSEIRSAILLGLIGFVIYPLLPNKYIDPWELLNLSDAWISVIAIAGIGFVNYVLLRAFSTQGLYLGAVFGGLVNSSATVAELSDRAQSSGMKSSISILCLLTTIAMFVRNLVLATFFSPDTLAATLLPLLAMSGVAGFWIWKDLRKNHVTPAAAMPPALNLSSPVSVPKVARFALLFILIQVGGTLLTRLLGSYGILATGVFGGLVSSASTTAAAATMAMHGKITPSLAGSAIVLTSLSSAAINLPIVWRTIHDKTMVKRLTIEMVSILLVGVLAVVADRIFMISELFVNK
ncbi:uncharacterized membrane protein (DUF4010 family) [Chitinophaga dinghuensis]|uniref:Uncharacterized membrane protein (DUF4010 family) n=1 Tax=Chitinophaga dinghuensis TaxID=1539050 RepID=A0A327VTD4_9BACT|nr:DUF4010 domain-containing protein [Chitinophaga dinghuensis]RAJ77289.1 uncharacterized membrane protein (DUF4010 family) [Chitinophaga dinghuensis]